MGTDPNLVDVVLSEDVREHPRSGLVPAFSTFMSGPGSWRSRYARQLIWYYDRVQSVWGIDLKTMFSSANRLAAGFSTNQLSCIARAPASGTGMKVENAGTSPLRGVSLTILR